jgi:hypothetical protein
MAATGHGRDGHVRDLGGGPAVPPTGGDDVRAARSVGELRSD